MFHWICPECGREIAPGVKECSACDPHAEPVRAAKVAESNEIPILIPEIVGHDPEAHLREIVGRMRVSTGAPPSPATMTRPMATQPAAPVSAPVMVQVLAVPKIPELAARVPDGTLHEPPIAAPARPPIRGADLKGQPSPLAGGAKGLFLRVALPPVGEISAKPQGSMPSSSLGEIVEQMASQISPAAPPESRILSAVEPAETLNGPRLPHELVSLDGAGISQIRKVVPAESVPGLGSKIPSWVVTSLVAATLVAGCLSFAFYAMPGMARPRVEAPQALVEESAAESIDPASPVEVTGIRIVALPGKRPEILYLVVNHTSDVLQGVNVQVTLRTNRGREAALVSSFAFVMPRLAAYEAREMVSPVESVVAPGPIPDWHTLRADVRVTQ